MLNAAKRIPNLVGWLVFGFISLMIVPLAIGERSFGLLVAAAVLVLLTIRNFNQWRKKAHYQINNLELIKKPYLEILGVVELLNKDGQKQKKNASLGFNSDEKTVIITFDVEKIQIDWDEISELFIQNAGPGVNSRLFIHADKNYIFYIAKSKQAADAIIRTGSIGLLFGSKIGISSSIPEIAKTRDMSILYPYFDLNSLFYWLQNHKASFRYNRIAPSMFGIIFTLTIIFGGILLAIVFESVAKNLSSSSDVASGIGSIGFAIPFFVLLAYALIKIHRMSKFI